MIKQNPFSLYDFLGYLIPGALLCYVFLFLLKIDNINSINDIILIVSNNQEFQFDKILFFVIISYSLGHLISYLSSITIERYSYWKYDYPSKYLLGLNKKQKYFPKKKHWKLLLIKTILAILLLPITTLDLILGEYFNFKTFYTKKLDSFLIQVIKDKNLELLDILYPPYYDDLKKYDFHRIISHYVYENSKNHQSKMINYVALYGFLRAVTLIVNFIFWIFLIVTIQSSYKYLVSLKYIKFGILFSSIDYTRIFLLLFIAIITYIYFMGFMKFYRRYTLEAYMLVAIDKEIKGESKEKEKKTP